MTLTAKEERLLQRISRPWWPKVTLYGILIIAVGGMLSLGLAIKYGVELDHLNTSNVQLLLDTAADAWRALVIGSTALMSSFFMWGARRFGLLIRKLSEPT